MTHTVLVIMIATTAVDGLVLDEGYEYEVVRALAKRLIDAELALEIQDVKKLGSISFAKLYSRWN